MMSWLTIWCGGHPNATWKISGINLIYQLILNPHHEAGYWGRLFSSLYLRKDSGQIGAVAPGKRNRKSGGYTTSNWYGYSSPIRSVGTDKTASSWLPKHPVITWSKFAPSGEMVIQRDDSLNSHRGQITGGPNERVIDLIYDIFWSCRLMFMSWPSAHVMVSMRRVGMSTRHVIIIHLSASYIFVL